MDPNFGQFEKIDGNCGGRDDRLRLLRRDRKSHQYRHYYTGEIKRLAPHPHPSDATPFNTTVEVNRLSNEGLEVRPSLLDRRNHFSGSCGFLENLLPSDSGNISH
ncbi:hypothetical protein [Acidovorax cavernicola]|uniref:hypothetical protein n=1 Tax=Acidovorax cavernicola TaxID=1675792 RepID=UPI0011C357B5|nr:hypothetical protein [Acidovorax cavernicola]